jgi:hypothetical protein
MGSELKFQIERKNMAKTKTEFLLEIVEAYRAAGNEWPAPAKNIGAWAIQQGHWKSPIKGQIDQCAHEIAAAMREDIFIDPQGRTVRKKHPFPDVVELPDGKHEQQYLWIDMEDPELNHEHAERALQYGRKLIAGDCKSLKTSVDSYNDNNKHGKYIEIYFNFIPDLEEAEQPTVYPGL